MFLQIYSRYSFAIVIADVESVLATASKNLFHTMQSSRQSLLYILPPKTYHNHRLRNPSHAFILPQCETNLFRFSFEPFLYICLVYFYFIVLTVHFSFF